MKKIFFLLAATFAAFSCTMEIKPEVPQETDGIPMTISASIDAGTKALLDGLQVKWEASDKLSIFDGGFNNCPFTSTNTEPAAAADFQGTIKKLGEKYYALYPYNGNNTRYNNTSNAELSAFGYYFPITQKIPAGGVDKRALVMTAESTNLSFTFQPFCGLIRFTIQEEGITSMSFKCNGRTSLGMSSYYTSLQDRGTWYIANPNGNTDTLIAVPAEGDAFVKGATYNMALLPANYDKGVIFKFTRADGKVAVMSSLNELKVGKGDIRDLGTIADLDWKDEGAIPQSFTCTSPVTNWTLKGSMFVIPAGQKFPLGSHISLLPATADQRMTLKSDNPDIKIDSEGNVTIDKLTTGTITVQSIALPALKTTLNVSSHGAFIDGVYYGIDSEKGTASVTNFTYQGTSAAASYTGDVVIKPSIEVCGKTFPVKLINYSAFGSCKELTSLSIPEGIDSIAPAAFGYLTMLKELKLPKSLRNIDTSNSVFSGSPDLVVTAHEGSEYFVSKGDMLYKYEEPGKPELKFIWMPENKEGDVVFDANTTKFASSCMIYVRKASSIEIPAGAGLLWYFGAYALPDNFVLKFNYPTYAAFQQKWTHANGTDYSAAPYPFGSNANKKKITLSVPAGTTDADLTKYMALGFKTVVRRTE